jgi:hypothetical protein
VVHLKLTLFQKRGKVFQLRGEGLVNMTTVPEVRQDIWASGQGKDVVNLTLFQKQGKILPLFQRKDNMFRLLGEDVVHLTLFGKQGKMFWLLGGYGQQ